MHSCPCSYSADGSDHVETLTDPGCSVPEEKHTTVHVLLFRHLHQQLHLPNGAVLSLSLIHTSLFLMLYKRHRQHFSSGFEQLPRTVPG